MGHAAKLLQDPVAAAKNKRIEEEFPRSCSCGIPYQTRKEWETLPKAGSGIQELDICTMAARNCSCGSTMYVIVEIHDLDEILQDPSWQKK